jgi:hypothetical protein
VYHTSVVPLVVGNLSIAIFAAATTTNTTH